MIKGFIAGVAFIFMFSGLLAQNTCTSNGTGGGSWNNTSTWNCTGGATYPDLTVSTINILDGDEITIANTTVGGFNSPYGPPVYWSPGNVPQDTLEVVINLAGDLIFDGLGAALLLTDDSQIIFSETGNLISNGAFYDVLFIGEDPVWNGQADGDVAGPGVMDDNTVGGVLPIVLMSFNASAFSEGVELNWVTVTEENNDYFTLERSADGITYEEIARIDGAGTSTEAKQYRYLDEHPISGKSYYRLSQTDFDGKGETFYPVAVNCSGFSEFFMTPNPITRGENLKVYTNTDSGEKLFLKIMDSSGVTVVERTIDAEDSYVSIDEDLKPGLYLVIVGGHRDQQIERLLVN